MAGRLEGKVAFITGAGRGQGRAHAVRMAEEGADIIAVDLCADIPSVNYPMSSVEDLAETERQVKEVGRSIVARQADVRERSELRDALEAGLTDLGHLDIVVANAGIFPYAKSGTINSGMFLDAIDVDLLGVMNTVAVCDAQIADHGSIIITGSTAAIVMEGVNTTAGSGGDGYGFAKHTIADYTEHLAVHMAPRFVRVNIMHPTNCNTMLIKNQGLYEVFRPDLENPTFEDVEPIMRPKQAMPVTYVEPEDVANLAVFLASEESRYITGMQIRVDAGGVLTYPGN